MNRWNISIAKFALLPLLTLLSQLERAAASDWDLLKVPSPKSYICLQTARPLKIDGRLDDVPWAIAPWTDEFADIEGRLRPKPRLRTRAKMLWDRQYFYIGAELEEPHVSGTLTNHDAVIFRDNDFELFIDPNGDNHEYYEVEINALNTVWDLFLKRPYKDGGPAENAWEIPGLKTAVHISGTLNDPSDVDRGWWVEIAIPWKVLGEFARRPAPPRNGDLWRVNFSRVEWRYEILDGSYHKPSGQKEDNWVWSPQGIIDMHRPEKWGYVQFTTTRPGAAKFRPDPDAPIRDLLMEIYYSEREYRAKQKRWSDSLESLGLEKLANERTQNVQLKLTSEGFEASASLKLPSGKIERWRINQDSRLWKTE